MYNNTLLIMDYIDLRIAKTYIPGKGMGFIATENISNDTIIIKEKPLTNIKDNIVYSDIFQLLYEILKNKQLSIKFNKLQPKSLQDYSFNKGKKERILSELKSLETHNSEIYSFLIENFNQEEILLYCAKYICNAFQFDNKPVILFNGTIFNHSCLPNVIFGQNGSQMYFMTCRNILKGEEICDNYIDIISNKKERQLQLKEQYGFVCQCERCNDKNSKKYDNKVLMIEMRRKKLFGFTKSQQI